MAIERIDFEFIANARILFFCSKRGREKQERRKKATKKKREKAFIIVEWMNEFNAKATNFEKKKNNLLLLNELFVH